MPLTLHERVSQESVRAFEFEIVVHLDRYDVMKRAHRILTTPIEVVDALTNRIAASDGVFAQCFPRR